MAWDGVTIQIAIVIFHCRCLKRACGSTNEKLMDLLVFPVEIHGFDLDFAVLWFGGTSDHAYAVEGCFPAKAAQVLLRARRAHTLQSLPYSAIEI